MAAQIDRELQKVLMAKIRTVEKVMDSVVVGHRIAKRLMLLALACGGNGLLEAVPGVAKTKLAKTLRACLGVLFARIQLTADVRVSDIIGFKVFNPRTGEFEFHEGPIMGVFLLLADEINRAPEQTQSALLEALEEHTITVDGETHNLDEMFAILTQNPGDQKGTFELLEALKDRLIFSLMMDHVSEGDETEMLRRAVRDDRQLAEIEPVMTKEEIIQLRQEVTKVALSTSRSVRNYVVRLVRATRPDDKAFATLHGNAAKELVQMIRYGGSPRAMIACLYMAAARAYLSGRDYVDYHDVQQVFLYTIRHRIGLTQEAVFEKFSVDDFARQVLTLVPTNADSPKAKAEAA